MSNELAVLLEDENYELNTMGLVVNQCLIEEGLSEEKSSNIVAKAMSITKGILSGEIEAIIAEG